MPADMTPDFSPVRPRFEHAYYLMDEVDRHLRPAETFMIALTLAAGLMGYAISIAFDQSVVWAAFLGVFAFSVGLIGTGTYMRVIKNLPRLGQGTVWAGIVVGFAAVMSLLCQLRIPLEGALLHG